MPKVSVIIPTYNRPEFLRIAISSVLRQSFSDFEIIVIDDASSADISSVITAFNDPRLRYARHAVNRGGSAARNTGIAQANSRYIAFLDDDDEWLSDKLCKQLVLLESSPSKIGGVYTGCFVVDKASGRIVSEKIPTQEGYLLDELLHHNCIGGTSSILLRKECFDKVGLFDETLQSFQDYDIFIRIANFYEFYCIKEPLYKYYLHNNSIWTNPAALAKGSKIVLKKYRKFKSFRSYISNFYFSRGILYCDSSNFRYGRKFLLRSIMLRPFSIRRCFYFCISLFRETNYRRSKKVKEKFQFLCSILMRTFQVLLTRSCR
jgi:glycosyltransferase involved in cell wall biosynthesis